MHQLEMTAKCDNLKSWRSIYPLQMTTSRAKKSCRKYKIGTPSVSAVTLRAAYNKMQRGDLLSEQERCDANAFRRRERDAKKRSVKWAVPLDAVTTVNQSFGKVNGELSGQARVPIVAVDDGRKSASGDCECSTPRVGGIFYTRWKGWGHSCS